MDNLPTRNNNPGDLRDTSSGSFRQFSSPQDGYAALLNDLHAKQTGTTTTGLGPSSTLADFANKYAPPGENDSAQYAANLANHMGVAPNTQLSQLDLGKWADAVAKTEGYQSGYNPKPFSNPKPGEFDFTGLADQQPTQAQKPNEPSKGLLGDLYTGASKVLSGAEKPFLGVTALPLQLGVKGYNAVTGSNVQDPFAGGVPGGLPGAAQNTGVTPLNLEKKAGDIAQVASYAIPGSEGLGAIAGGVGTGVLQGAGQAMSEGKTLTNVAQEAGIQGALGGSLVGGTKIAGTALRGIGDTLSGAGLQKAIQGIKEAYGSALNLTAAERGFEGRSGKDLAQVLLDHQAPLSRYENGTLDASAAIPKLQTALEPLNKAADAIVSKPEFNTNASNFISLDNSFNSLLERIKQSGMDSLEKESSIKTAQKLFAATRREYGDIVSPQVAEKIKQGLQGSAFKKALTSTDALQGNVTYLASNVLRKDIEKALGPAGAEYSKINAQRSDLVDAIKRLSKLDGVRNIKGGRLGNIAGGMVGAISGAASGLGPLGALAGDYFGTKSAQFMNNPATKIGAAQAKAKAAGILPGLAGNVGKVAGKGLGGIGATVNKVARPVGLLGNLLTSK